VVGSCEHNDEQSVSLKGRKFLDYLSDCSQKSLLHGMSSE